MVVEEEDNVVEDVEEEDDVVEEVQSAQDLTLLARFQQGLDTAESTEPPPGYVPDYWGERDGDDEACGPLVVRDDQETGF
jgi:hypothetical protein